MRTFDCPNCGYDLSGLHTDAGRVTCPECGRENPLGFTPKDPWLAAALSVVAGFGIMAVAVCVVTNAGKAAYLPMLYVGAGLGALASEVLARVADRRPQRALMKKRLVIASAVTVAVAVVNLLVAWFFHTFMGAV